MNEKDKNIIVPPRVAAINAEIAASPLGSQGISQSVNNVPLTGGASINNLGVVNIPSTLSSEAMKGESPIALPNINQTSTTPSAINAKVESNLTNTKTALEQEYKNYIEQAKFDAQNSRSKAQEYLGLGSQALNDRINALQTPEFKAKKELADRAYQDILTSRKSQDAEIKAISEANMTDAGRSAALRDLNNKYAFQNSQLSLYYNIASGAYESAKQDITDLYSLKMEAYKPYIDYYTQLANDDQKVFTQAERDILQRKADEYKFQQTQEANFVKQKGEMMLQAKENGADNATIQAMSRATDQSSLIQAAGQYAGDVLDRRLKIAQIQKAENEAKMALTALPSAVQARVQGIAGQFDAEPNVKTFNTIAQQKAFINSIPTNTTNPSDDQALVYAFAKIMDPDSVVREGEYNTVKKYAQSWAKAYGKGIEQAINGTGFLSEEARKNIKKTVDSRFKISEQAYNNTYNEYGRRIDKVTGRTDGKDYITDYKQAFSEQSVETDTNNPFSQALGGGTNNIWNPATGLFNIPTK